MKTRSVLSLVAFMAALTSLVLSAGCGGGGDSPTQPPLPPLEHSTATNCKAPGTWTVTPVFSFGFCLYPSGAVTTGTDYPVQEGCTFPSEQCLRDAGRFVAMEVVVNGQATIAVFIKRFSSISGMFWIAELVYANDLTRISANVHNPRLFTSDTEVDWVKTTSDGLTWHNKGANTCEMVAPDPADPSNWISAPHAC